MKYYTIIVMKTDAIITISKLNSTIIKHYSTLLNFNHHEHIKQH